jgi:WD40 repeat protein
LAIFGSWDDNTLKVWDLTTGNVIASFTSESAIACSAIAPDGVTIVAGTRSGRVYFLRLEGVEELT